MDLVGNQFTRRSLISESWSVLQLQVKVSLRGILQASETSTRGKRCCFHVFNQSSDEQILTDIHYVPWCTHSRQHWQPGGQKDRWMISVHKFLLSSACSMAISTCIIVLFSIPLARERKTYCAFFVIICITCIQTQRKKNRRFIYVFALTQLYQISITW